MRMTGLELQQATRGRWHGEPAGLVTGLSTDSRQMHAGEAFLALRGTHFDGHDFYRQAVQKGAAALIGDTAGIKAWHGALPPVLEVADTLAGLGDIAKAWRRRLRCPVVAITGSFGKTSVRAMLAHILERLGFVVAATRGNRNNLIGVPLTLLACRGDEDFVIVECGISEAGEMVRLADMVRPDVTIITGIGMAHSEGLGDLHAIAREKAALLAHTDDRGWCALGAGVATLLAQAGVEPQVPALAMENVHHAVTWHLTGRTLLLRAGEASAQVDMLLPARHWAANMALAASVARRLCHAELGTIAAALADWRPLAGRMSLLPGPGGSHIIDDAYNANPASMAAALDTLRNLAGGHFAVLGDMAELGQAGLASHAQLNLTGLDGLILVGPMMHSILDRHPRAQWAKDAASALDLALAWPLQRGDHVLIKGSRSMGLDVVATGLTEAAHAL